MSPAERSPPEVFFPVFYHVVRDRGGCTLLPLLHVCSQWRESALGDSSLWVAFYLSNVTPPFLDVILARHRDLVLNVSFDGQDVKSVGRVQYLLDKTEEFGLSTSHLCLLPGACRI